METLVFLYLMLLFNPFRTVLSAGLDSVSGMDELGGLIPACAPEELSNIRYDLRRAQQSQV